MAIRKNKKFIDPRYFMDEKTDVIKEAPFHDLESDDVGDGEYQTADAYELADELAKEAQNDTGLDVQVRGMLHPSGVQKNYQELMDIVHDNPDGVSAPFIRVRDRDTEITLNTFHAKDKSRDAVEDMGAKLHAWVATGAKSNRLGGPKWRGYNRGDYR